MSTSARSMSLRKGILSVTDYFELFQYAPSFNTIYTFLPIKANTQEVRQAVSDLVKKGVIRQFQNTHTGTRIYTKTVSRVKRDPDSRYTSTIQKEQSAQKWFAIMEKMPWVYGVGISGSCAMYHARPGDDLDVLIISAPGGMWLSRIVAIMTAKVLGMHRSRRTTQVSGKLCLNMYMDFQDMRVPEFKQNLYTAHEVIQMRPVFMRGRVYEAFLRQNAWVQKYAPNFSLPKVDEKQQGTQTPFVVKILEVLAKQVQLLLMSKKQGSEYITSTQLWFFPRDFARKIEKKIDIR